jgi:hypothetical protein
VPSTTSSEANLSLLMVLVRGAKLIQGGSRLNACGEKVEAAWSVAGLGPSLTSHRADASACPPEHGAESESAALSGDAELPRSRVTRHD